MIVNARFTYWHQLGQYYIIFEVDTNDCDGPFDLESMLKLKEMSLKQYEWNW